MIGALLVIEAIVAFALNAVLLTPPGCSPTWLTVSAMLGGFAPFFVGVQSFTQSSARWLQVTAAVAGLVAIGLSRASAWALACPGLA
jgi:hypothetical protein